MLRLTATLLALVLAACGGGGDSSGSSGGSGEDLSSQHYLPATVGDRWAYVDSEAGSDTLDSQIVKAARTDSVDGQAGVVLTDADGNGGVLQFEDASGVWQLPTADADVLTAAMGKRQLLRYPLRVADSFTSIDKSLGTAIDFDADGVGDPTSVKGTVQVIGVEPVTVSGQSFPGSLHVHTTFTYNIRLSTQSGTVVLTQTFDDWLAPGIGQVRSQQLVVIEGTSQSAVRNLTGYSVGGQRSDTAPPTASAASLTGGSALGPAATVAIDFNEDMDQTSLPPALRVVDSAGRAVAGSLSVTARNLQFTPAQPWATGHYSVSLAASATDLVGNAVAPVTWNFDIDATNPTVVDTQPIEGTVDVPLATQIVLHFSEPVLASSVNADTVRVLYAGDMLGAVTYEVSGAQVTLNSPTGLVRGQPYRITIAGVTDLAGNAVTATQLSFTTDPGRFGTATPLTLPNTSTAITTTATAIGDVNGDGRTDVVASSLQFTANGLAYQLLVYAQQVNGTLGTGVPVSLRNGASVIDLAIGDVNGDGRNDILVAEGDGVEIFLQSAGGSFAAGQWLTTATASCIKLVDLNADGRLDLVVYGNGSLQVWRNLASGWALNDDVVVDGSVASDLVVADLNGDGRPDVAFTADQLPNFAAAGILKQGSDGHLAGPEWLHADTNEAATSLAAGDANGDGRVDLVLSFFVAGLQWMQQQPDGTLATMRTIDSTMFPGPVRLVDINGDGRPDVVTMDVYAQLAVRLQQADGSWAAASLYPGNFFLGTDVNPTTMSFGDINGDGRLDVVANGYRFIQRPVAVNAASLRPGGPAASANWRSKQLQNIRPGTKAAR